MDNADKVLPLMKVLKHSESGEICRLPMPCTQEIFDSSMRFKAKKDDVFVCSWPKSGTTWLQHIVWLITHYGEDYFEDKAQSECIPMLEFQGEHADTIDTRGYQRVIKTHFPYKWVPFNSEALYLCVARDPKDALVSLYYHMKGFGFYQASDLDISTLYDMFMKGEVEFNDYYEHVAEWYKHRNDSNVLFLLYEDMKENLEREVVKVAKFLGRDYLERLQAEDGVLLKDIVRRTTFKTMSTDPTTKWVFLNAFY